MLDVQSVPSPPVLLPTHVWVNVLSHVLGFVSAPCTGFSRLRHYTEKIHDRKEHIKHIFLRTLNILPMFETVDCACFHHDREQCHVMSGTWCMIAILQCARQEPPLFWSQLRHYLAVLPPHRPVTRIRVSHHLRLPLTCY